VELVGSGVGKMNRHSELIVGSVWNAVVESAF
jgi:hypothetical protein